MSKIYKALEKAELERESESNKSLYPPQMFEKEEMKRLEIPPPSRGVEEMTCDRRLVSIFQPGSLAAEQFRRLRNHMLRFNLVKPFSTIMVTSAMKGEGKSFVAANLAAGISLDLHAYALLVDCDLRDSTLIKWFNLPNGKGLSDYLVGKGEVAQFILKTGIEKLSLLPGGSVQDNPAELIGSERMGSLVDELKSRYRDRFVILDSTPLLATTEPQVMAKLVDGILIVVRAGVTPRETVQQALQTIDREKIIGVVLNDITFKAPGLYSRYFGSDGYYYKYGYGGYGVKGGQKSHNRWGNLFRFIGKSN